MNLANKIKIMAAAGASAMAMAVAMVVPLEGTEYKPYYDVVGVLTVCNGHTGSDIIKDKVYTKEECNALLEEDLGKVKKQVDPIIKPALPETARAAIYSFAYNVGIGNFSRSTMLKKLNRGDLSGACDELKRWVYAGGRKWKGLITRRQIEETVCELDLHGLNVRFKQYIADKDAGYDVSHMELFNTGYVSKYVYEY